MKQAKNTKPQWRKYWSVDGLEVSKGGGVRRIYTRPSRFFGNQKYAKMLSRQTDADGNVFVEVRTPSLQKLRVDELVARCFYRDVKQPLSRHTFLNHKDGDKSHCWADNLEWVTPYEYGQLYPNDPNMNTPDGFRQVKDNLYVSQDGRAKQDGGMLTVCDSFFDADTGQEVAVSPYVRNNATNKRERVEDLVASAYLPEPAGISNPGLLHMDKDYKNCSASNLKWVESDSSEYKEYLNKRDDDMAKRMAELNPHPVTHQTIQVI